MFNAWFNEIIETVAHGKQRRHCSKHVCSLREPDEQTILRFTTKDTASSTGCRSESRYEVFEFRRRFLTVVFGALECEQKRQIGRGPQWIETRSSLLRAHAIARAPRAKVRKEKLQSLG